MKIKMAWACAAISTVLVSGVALAAATATVDQRALAFSVASLTVNRGDTVNFTNSDTTSHNILVTGEGVRLNSGLQAPGVAFRAPFLRSGSYQVICGIHPRMRVAVTVR